MPRRPRARREPTFADAQRWWTPMRQGVTFTGVAGHPWQPAVLWNAGLLFWPLHRSFAGGHVRHGGPTGPDNLTAGGYVHELDGYENDALHVEFSFGRRMHLPDRRDSDAGEIAQSLEDGRLPIVLSRLRHGRLAWTQTVFSRLPDGMEAETGDEILLTEVRWTGRNRSARPAEARLHAHLASPHVCLGYKVAMHDRALPCLRRLRLIDGGLVCDNVGRARLAAACTRGQVTFHESLPASAAGRAEADLAALGLDRDLVAFRAKVPAGASVSLRLVIPYFAVGPDVLEAALATSFAAARKRVRAYWADQLAAGGSIRTADPVANDAFDAYLCQAMLATGRKPRCGHWILKTSPNHYEDLWAAHAAIAAFSMDLRGRHRWSRRVLETFLATQGPVPASMVSLLGERGSESFSAHPGFLGNIEGHMAVLWAFYHGWTLWAIGRHARLSRDWRWLARHADRIALACEWVAVQRRRTKRRDGRGRKALAWGLLPASNAFDWGFGHMFWSDAHTYRGLREAAECLARVGHPDAARWAKEAEAYRRDIVAAVERSRDGADPVPLDDGTTIPYVPMAAEMLDCFETDWTYVACGPLNLPWAGVVPPDHELVDQTLAYLDAGRPLGQWLPAEGKHRGWDWGVRAKADEDFLPATRPRRGRPRLWRRRMTYEPGWIPQAFTFLARDDLHELFEHVYSLLSNGGQYVHLRSPVEQRDGVAWCQPGQACLMWLLRDMLAREDGDDLLLCGACPRAWLAEGETLGATGLLTTFGTVGFELTSRRGARHVRGRFDMRWKARPRRIRLRLRHPRGALPASVAIDGEAAAADGEWIELPHDARTLDVRYP